MRLEALGAFPTALSELKPLIIIFFAKAQFLQNKLNSAKFPISRKFKSILFFKKFFKFILSRLYGSD